MQNIPLEHINDCGGYGLGIARDKSINQSKYNIKILNNQIKLKKQRILHGKS